MRPTNRVSLANTRSAFSLFELLIVLAIIGLLAALVLPRFGDAFGKGQRKSTEAQMSSLESAVESFKLDHGRYPTQEEGLGALIIRPSDIEEADWKPYLSKATLPMDGWKRPFIYKTDDDFGFRIISYGADGQPGGDGENKDLDIRE